MPHKEYPNALSGKIEELMPRDTLHKLEEFWEEPRETPPNVISKFYDSINKRCVDNGGGNLYLFWEQPYMLINEIHLYLLLNACSEVH